MQTSNPYENLKAQKLRSPKREDPNLGRRQRLGGACVHRLLFVFVVIPVALISHWLRKPQPTISVVLNQKRNRKIGCCLHNFGVSGR